MAQVEEITLSSLVLEKTGMQLRHFARIYKFSYYNLIAWNYPKTSKASRVPNAKNLVRLAGILNEPEQRIYDLCTRPNDIPWEW